MRVTIIIPTHEHGRLLLPSVRSVLRQTVQDFELFIIGDGVTPETRAAAAEAVSLDPRIRFFDHPKSPRTGEPYRHTLLNETATGDVVCYLPDDDFWFPDHLEVLCRALENADMVHSLPMWVDENDAVFSSLIDFSVQEWVNWTLGGHNKIGLSNVGHTMDFYRRLPHGWRTTPAGSATDAHMWRQMLAVPGMRAVCTGGYTALRFPSARRKSWSLERREQELLAWEEKIQRQPGEIAKQTRRAIALSYYQLEVSYAGAKQQIEHLAAENKTLNSELRKWEQRRVALPGFLRNLSRWYWRKKGL